MALKKQKKTTDTTDSSAHRTQNEANTKAAARDQLGDNDNAFFLSVNPGSRSECSAQNRETWKWGRCLNRIKSRENYVNFKLKDEL